MQSNDHGKPPDNASPPARIPSTAREVEHVQSTVSACFEAIQSRYEGLDVGMLQTGFAEFDALTSGLRPEELIVVGGRPSSGKSAFTMSLCLNLALRSKTPVAIFSMEMTSQRLAERMLASLSQVDLQRLQTGKLDDEDWPRITSAKRQLRNAPIYIDDTPALTPEELCTKVATLKSDHQIALVVIDYLQLMQVTGWPENEAAQLAEISRRLKALAKEQKIIIIAISQMNRLIEYRQDRKPQLSDLRGAGSLEDDADIVVLLHRAWHSHDHGLIEMAVRKQRNGPIGSFAIRISGETVSVDSTDLNLTPGQESAQNTSNHAPSRDEPINEKYIAKALEPQYAESEVVAALEQLGFLALTPSGSLKPTELAEPFLHPSPAKGRIWHRRIIAFLQSKEPSQQ